MSDLVNIQISKSSEFTPDNILKDIEKPFDHNLTIETQVEVEAQDLLPEYFKVYGRARYQVPDSTGTSRWSNTRSFQFMLDDNVTSGLVHWSLGYSNDSWKQVNIKGKIINRLDYRNNLIFKGIKDYTDSKGNQFVEIPQVFIKVLPDGIKGSESAGKMTWMISAVKNDDGYQLHPAFIRNGKELKVLRIGKFASRKNPDGRMVSKPTHGYYLTNNNDYVEVLRNKVRDEDPNYRLFDIWDLSLIRMLVLLFTQRPRPVLEWFTFKDGLPNSILRISDLQFKNELELVDKIFLTPDNKIAIQSSSNTNELGKIVSAVSNGTLWQWMSKEKIGNSDVNAMLAFLPQNGINDFTSLFAAVGVEGSEYRYAYLHYPWQKTNTYIETYQEWSDTAYINRTIYQWEAVGRSCWRCGYYTKDYTYTQISYLKKYGSKERCPNYYPGYNRKGHIIKACILSSSGIPPIYGWAQCATIGGCPYKINQISGWTSRCTYYNGPPREDRCNLVNRYEYRGGYVTKTRQTTQTLANDNSIYSTKYSNVIANRIFRFCTNTDE